MFRVVKAIPNRIKLAQNRRSAIVALLSFWLVLLERYNESQEKLTIVVNSISKSKLAKFQKFCKMSQVLSLNFKNHELTFNSKQPELAKNMQKNIRN